MQASEASYAIQGPQGVVDPRKSEQQRLLALALRQNTQIDNPYQQSHINLQWQRTSQTVKPERISMQPAVFIQNVVRTDETARGARETNESRLSLHVPTKVNIDEIMKQSGPTTPENNKEGKMQLGEYNIQTDRLENSP